MQKNSYKIVLVLLILAGIIFGVNSVFHVLHCNMRRDYKVDTDKKIINLREKIADIEKEQVKDFTASNRLLDYYNQLGTIYLEKRLWDMAIESFQNCMKNGTPGAPVYYSLGLAYGNRGYERNTREDIELAEQNYRKAIELKPDYADAVYGLAIILFYHRDAKDEALTMVETLSGKNRTYYPARFAVARFNYEKGNREKALRTYEELHTDLEKLPSSEIINEYRARCKENISIIMAEMATGR